MHSEKMGGGKRKRKTINKRYRKTERRKENGVNKERKKEYKKIKGKNTSDRSKSMH